MYTICTVVNPALWAGIQVSVMERYIGERVLASAVRY